LTTAGMQRTGVPGSDYLSHRDEVAGCRAFAAAKSLAAFTGQALAGIESPAVIRQIFADQERKAKASLHIAPVGLAP
jgi:hypothetical protein